jgi:hypothetical protein
VSLRLLYFVFRQVLERPAEIAELVTRFLEQAVVTERARA